MAITLLSLPNEVLIEIIEHAEDACIRTFLNLRLTSKTLGQLCHERFLHHLEKLRIDPSQEDDLTHLMEIVSSPLHARAVRTVVFDFERNWHNVWAVTPLVQQLFDKLSTLNATIELKFSPYSNEWVSEPSIVAYIGEILKMSSTSRLPIDRLVVRAKDWNTDSQLEELDRLSCRLSELLVARGTDAKASSMMHLVVRFQHGEASYNCQNRCLRVNQFTAHDLRAISGWTQQTPLAEIGLTNCQFFVGQLDGVLLPATLTSGPLSRITITNSRLIHRFQPTLLVGNIEEAVPLRKLLACILQRSDDLVYLHLEDIRTDVPHPRTLNFAGEEKVKMEGNDNIREMLTHLMLQHSGD